MNRTVCFCNSNRTWGGGEKWHLEAACAMAERGCCVHLMAGKDSPLYDRARAHPELTLHAKRFSGLDFLNPFTVRRCAALFREHGINRVVLGLPSDLKAAGIAAKRAGVAGIYYRRGSALPVRDDVLNRYLYGRLLTGLIVNSWATAQLVLAENAALIAADKIHLLYNGLDIAAFDAALAMAAPAYRRNPDVADALVIGNAGRLTAQKGQHYLLHMSRCLLDINLKHRLIIAGDGERRAELEALAASLDLGDAVTFAGFVDDMAPFWRSLDCFVFSSLWEGFGYALAEAMLAGKTVIAFDGNSMPELVQSGATGMLVPLPRPGEDDASVGSRLAARVVYFVQNTAECDRLAANGREFCRNTFSQEKRMDELHALLWPEGAYDSGR
jgi:glycosyltransferase involved in cell wall biosynthesis